MKRTLRQLKDDTDDNNFLFPFLAPDSPGFLCLIENSGVLWPRVLDAGSGAFSMEIDRPSPKFFSV